MNTGRVLVRLLSHWPFSAPVFTERLITVLPVGLVYLCEISAFPGDGHIEICSDYDTVKSDRCIPTYTGGLMSSQLSVHVVRYTDTSVHTYRLLFLNHKTIKANFAFLLSFFLLFVLFLLSSSIFLCLFSP